MAVGRPIDERIQESIQRARALVGALPGDPRMDPIRATLTRAMDAADVRLATIRGHKRDHDALAPDPANDIERQRLTKLIADEGVALDNDVQQAVKTFQDQTAALRLQIAAEIAAQKRLALINAINLPNNDNNIRTALINIANAAGGDDAIRGILVANKDNLGAGAIAHADFRELSSAQLQEIVGLAKEQAIIKSIASLDNTEDARRALDRLLGRLVGGLGIRDIDKAGLGRVNEIANLDGLEDAQIDRIFTAARIKHSEFILSNAINNLNDANNNEARLALGRVAAVPRVNFAEIRTQLMHADNKDRLGLAAIPNLDGVTDAQLQAIWDITAAKSKNFNTLHAINSLADPNDDERAALSRVAAVDRAIPADIRTALLHADNKDRLGLAAIANLDGVTDAQLQAIWDIAAAKSKNFNTLHAINSLADPSNADARAALGRLAAVPRDNFAEIRNQLMHADNKDRLGLAAIPNLDGVTDAQLQAIWDIVSRKSKTFNTLHHISTLNDPNSENVRRALENIAGTALNPPNHVNVRAAISAQAAVLGLPANPLDDVSPEQIANVHAAITTRNKYLKTVYNISNLTNSNDTRNALARIAALVNVNVIRAQLMDAANKNHLGLRDIADLAGIRDDQIRTILNAAISKDRELKVIHAIDVINTADGAGNDAEGLEELNRLLSANPTPALRREEVRRVIFERFQRDYEYIPAPGIGLDGSANDRNILSDAVVDRIFNAAHAKANLLRPRPVVNEALMTELRTAIKETSSGTLSPRLIPALNALIPPAPAPNQLGGTTPELATAITDLKNLLATAPPPAANDTQVIQAIKIVKAGLEQQLMFPLRETLDAQLLTPRPSNELLANINAMTIRVLNSDNGLNATNPIRSHVQQLQTTIATIDAAPAPTPPASTKEEQIRKAITTFKEAIEKQQLLAITQILRNPGADPYSDLSVLLPHLNSATGLRADHPLKTQNRIQPVVSAIRDYKNAAPPANAEREIADAAITTLKNSIKDVVRESRERDLYPELAVRAQKLKAEDRQGIIDRIDPLNENSKFSAFRKEVERLEIDAQSARDSRSREKELPAINKKLDSIKFDLYVYRESLRESQNKIPYTDAQIPIVTTLLQQLNERLTPPAGPAVAPSKAQILGTLRQLLEGPDRLVDNHILRPDFLRLLTEAQTPGPDLPNELITLVRDVLQENQSLADANIRQNWPTYLEKLNIRIATCTQLISRADVVLGKSERATQKPIKITSAPTHILQQAEVVPHANIEAKVAEYLGTDINAPRGILGGKIGKVENFDGNSNAKVTRSMIGTAGVDISLLRMKFVVHGGPLNVVSVQKNDAQGNHISELRYDPSKVGMFTSKDTYTQWAVTEIENYIRDATNPPKSISIVGNLPEKLVWQMMLYCHHKGIKPNNRTEHSGLTQDLYTMLEKPAENQSERLQFERRLNRLYPGQPEITQSKSEKDALQKATEAPRPRP